MAQQHSMDDPPVQVHLWGALVGGRTKDYHLDITKLYLQWVAVDYNAGYRCCGYVATMAQNLGHKPGTSLWRRVHEGN